MKINRGTSHPSAFISSTFVDLKVERAAVADALKSRGILVNALDINPASTGSSKNTIIRGIEESDFIILLIGDRYGSILERITGNKSDSITLWEYKAARSRGKPVIAYFKTIVGNNPQDHDDRLDPSYGLKRQRFAVFKERVTSSHNPAYFNTTSDLSQKIDQALISVYRDGVRNLHEENFRLANKVSDLEAEISRLNSPLPSSQPPPISDNSLFEYLSGSSTISKSEGLLRKPLSGIFDED